MQGKMDDGKLWAFSTVWQAGLTAAEMHHEHPARAVQDEESLRALQVSSSGPLAAVKTGLTPTFEYKLTRYGTCSMTCGVAITPTVGVEIGPTVGPTVAC